MASPRVITRYNCCSYGCSLLSVAGGAGFSVNGAAQSARCSCWCNSLMLVLVPVLLLAAFTSAVSRD